MIIIQCDSQLVININNLRYVQDLKPYHVLSYMKWNMRIQESAQNKHGGIWRHERTTKILPTNFEPPCIPINTMFNWNICHGQSIALLTWKRMKINHLRFFSSGGELVQFNFIITNDKAIRCFVIEFLILFLLHFNDFWYNFLLFFQSVLC